MNASFPPPVRPAPVPPVPSSAEARVSKGSPVPRHDPVVPARRAPRTGVGFAGAMLVNLALWSLIGAVAALRLGATEAAFDFMLALLGAGITLILLGLYEGRRA